MVLIPTHNLKLFVVSHQKSEFGRSEPGTPPR